MAKLQLDEYKQELQKTLSSQLASSPPDQSVTNTAHDAVDEEWNRIRDVTYKAASDTLGFVISKHRDWFDEQDTETNVYKVCTPPTSTTSTVRQRGQPTAVLQSQATYTGQTA